MALSISSPAEPAIARARPPTLYSSTSQGLRRGCVSASLMSDSSAGASSLSTSPVYASTSRPAAEETVAPKASTSYWIFAALRRCVLANATCSSTCAVPGTASKRLPAFAKIPTLATELPLSMDTTRTPLGSADLVTVDVGAIGRVAGSLQRKPARVAASCAASQPIVLKAHPGNSSFRGFWLAASFKRRSKKLGCSRRTNAVALPHARR